MTFVTTAQIAITSGAMLFIDPTRTAGYDSSVLQEHIFAIERARLEGMLASESKVKELEGRVLAPPKLLQGSREIVFRGSLEDAEYCVLKTKGGVAVVLNAAGEISKYKDDEISFVDPDVRGVPGGITHTTSGLQLIADARAYQPGAITRSEYAIVPIPNGVYICRFSGDRLVEILRS